MDQNTWKTLFGHTIDTGEHKVLVTNILSVAEAKWVWLWKHQECLTEENKDTFYYYVVLLPPRAITSKILYFL